VKLKPDLHEIYNRGDDIDRALRAITDEAIEKKVRLVEIIPGKGSGQLEACIAIPRPEGDQGAL
jgi:dsDNA-specific endonuclease/ATPase MutS2